MRLRYLQTSLWFLPLAAVILLGGACSRKSIPVEKQHLSGDGKYDTGPPVQGVAGPLEEIARSVYRLNVIAFYETYTFDKLAAVTAQKLKTEDMTAYAHSHTISSESVLGTASVIYSGNGQAVLLTCAHVVYFPDTVISYFPDNSGFVRSLAIKLKQKSYVAGLDNPNVKILAADNKNDIALLEATVSPVENIRVLPFPTGKSSELNWGTFVYVVGFPQGEKMVENGIVSRPDKTGNGFFLTNTLFNRGISGGPVFALRDGASGFEWVGMAKSSPATEFLYLAPSINKRDTYSKSEPYTGKILINKKKVINYGMTYSVSIEEILKFVRRIGPELEKDGFDVQQFFYRPPED